MDVLANAAVQPVVALSPTARAALFCTEFFRTYTLVDLVANKHVDLTRAQRLVVFCPKPSFLCFHLGTLADPRAPTRADYLCGMNLTFRDPSRTWTPASVMQAARFVAEAFQFFRCRDNTPLVTSVVLPPPCLVGAGDNSTNNGPILPTDLVVEATAP